MATAKKKKQPALKNKWAYTIGAYEDEICNFYPSEKAAMDAAKEDLVDNYEGNETVYIWEAVKAIDVAVEVREVAVTVMKKEANVKELAKNG